VPGTDDAVAGMFIGILPELLRTGTGHAEVVGMLEFEALEKPLLKFHLIY